MKTRPHPAPPPSTRRPALSWPARLERLIVFGLLAATLFFFIDHNGFIDASGVWAYPY